MFAKMQRKTFINTNFSCIFEYYWTYV